MAALRLDSREIIREKLDLVAALEQILARLALDRAAGGGGAGPSPSHADPTRRHYDALGCDLKPVAPGAAAFRDVEAYLRRGWPDASLEALFESTVGQQEAAFAPHRGEDVRLLWHGSSLANWAGILNGGLRIAPPEAPSNGYNFDKGLYFADNSKKSGQYFCGADVVRGRVAATPRLRRGYSMETEPRRRRGCDAAIRWRRAAATS